VRRPIVPGPLERYAHPPVGQLPEAVFGQRRPEHVAAELLQPRPIAGAYPHVRVQIESLQVRVARAASSHCGRRQSTAEQAYSRHRVIVARAAKRFDIMHGDTIERVPLPSTSTTCGVC